MLNVSTGGVPQRDANKLLGAKGRNALAPMEVPAAHVIVPAGTPAGPPNNVAALYRRLAHAIRTGERCEPDFAHALARHRLIDAITRSSVEGRSVAVVCMSSTA